MKRVISYLALFVVGFAFVGVSQLMAQNKQVNWDSFRENLVKNLSSNNPGIRESALQLIDRYSVELGLKTDEEENGALKLFQKNLEQNLASSNYGVRQSAIQLITQYGDKLKLDREAIFSLMRVYRYDKDINFRKMALAALYKTGDKWAMGFLKTSLDFEKDESLKHIIQAIVVDFATLPVAAP